MGGREGEREREGAEGYYEVNLGQEKGTESECARDGIMITTVIKYNPRMRCISSIRNRELTLPFKDALRRMSVGAQMAEPLKREQSPCSRAEIMPGVKVHKALNEIGGRSN